MGKEEKTTGAGLRRATAWTSPSVGLCRFGPAPVYPARLLEPRDPSRKPPLCEELDRVRREASAACRGVQPSAQPLLNLCCRRLTRLLQTCALDCKLRASRVLGAGSTSIPTGAHTLGPRLSKSPTSPETFGVAIPRCVVCIADSGAAVSARLRWPEVFLRPAAPVPPVRESLLFCFQLSASCFLAASEVPPSVGPVLHCACHIAPKGSRCPDTICNHLCGNGLLGLIRRRSVAPAALERGECERGFTCARPQRSQRVVRQGIESY